MRFDIKVIGRNVRVYGKKTDLQKVADRFAFERPERQKIRRRLYSYALNAKQIEFVLQPGVQYGQLISVLGSARKNGLPLTTKLTKNLAGQIWTARGQSDLVRIGRIEGGGYGDDRFLCLPRGLCDKVAAKQTIDWRTVGDPVQYTRNPKYALRGYQDRAVKKMDCYSQGILVAPCGAGKTVMGCSIIAGIGRKAVILVHTLDLLNQWKENIKDFFGLEAAVIGGGEPVSAKALSAPITIATIQTLHRSDWAQDAKTAGLKNGILIVDECHHVPAETFGEVVGKFPALHRYGLTATPYREDGWTPMISAVMGDIIHQITHADLYAAGSLVRAQVWEIPLQTDRPPFDPTSEWAKFLTAVCMDASRISDICRWISDLKKSDRFSAGLALCGRVDQAQAIAETLQVAHGIRAEAIYGKKTKKQRKEILKKAREEEISVLCATSLADEGLDLPILDAAFFCAPQRAAGATVQRLGRIMRPAPQKNETNLFDFVDRNIGICKSQYYTRRQAYKSVDAHLMGKIKEI